MRQVLLAGCGLLRSRRWAQRGLDRLANEEVLTDRESVAGFAEALQAIVDVIEPAQVRGIGNTAQLLALIDLVELLLWKAPSSPELMLTSPRLNCHPVLAGSSLEHGQLRAGAAQSCAVFAFGTTADDPSFCVASRGQNRQAIHV